MTTSAERPSGPSTMAEVRQARHEQWLRRQQQQHQLQGQGQPDNLCKSTGGHALNDSDESLARRLQEEEDLAYSSQLSGSPLRTVEDDQRFAQQLQEEEDRASARSIAKAKSGGAVSSQNKEPEEEPMLSAGWGEGPTTTQRGRGQMGIVAVALRGVPQPRAIDRFPRSNPDCIFFAWVERMALSVGNAGHEARNNLRFAAVALEKRRGRQFGDMGLLWRMPGIGFGGMHGGIGIPMHCHGLARIEENPDHPKNLEPKYFQQIDALSGQLEGLCRGVATQSRQHQRHAIRERLLPAALAKVEAMEDLTERTKDADIDEMQRAEMLRIISLQRRYLDALSASLSGSRTASGLPRPDEVLDFSAGNAEVSKQVSELTEAVEHKGVSLQPQQLILLSRIVCNTGHQLQNLAARCVGDDPGSADLAKRIDDLGGEIENRSRSIMVTVHRQEDTGMTPISSRQDIAKNCAAAWKSAVEIAELATSRRLAGRASAAEMAPTLARLRHAVRWLNESALLDIENELSFGFGLFGPKLTSRGSSCSSAPELVLGKAADAAMQPSESASNTKASASSFDVVVLGAGPAGTAAAEAAAERGLRCAVVEPRGTGIGTGTGFKSKVAHIGITEALQGSWQGLGLGTPLSASEDARSRLRRDISRQQREKSSDYGQRVKERLQAARVNIFTGCATLRGPHNVMVSDYDAGESYELSFDFLVICTGSRPRHPPVCQVDGHVLHDYKTIEEADARDFPASIVVVGGGVIACETACHMAEFGVKTTLLAPRALLKDLDPLLTETFTSLLKERRGVDIRCGCEVRAILSDGCRARVELAGHGGVLEADAVVVALGSVPNTEWLGLENVPGLRLNTQGAVEVDEDMRSSVPHIFACGDCCSRGGLLSLAKRQGLLACMALHRDRSRILATPPAEAPAVIWTIPEMATVGTCGGRTGSFDVVTKFSECDRGLLETADKSYFLKMVYETQILPPRVHVRGVHIFGPHAEKLIAHGASLLGKTVEEALGAAMPVAATLEELYTLNLQAAAKRTAEWKSQSSDESSCAAM